MTSNQETLAGVAQCTSTGHGDAEAPQTLHSMGRWRDCSGIGALLRITCQSGIAEIAA